MQNCLRYLVLGSMPFHPDTNAFISNYTFNCEFGTNKTVKINYLWMNSIDQNQCIHKQICILFIVFAMQDSGRNN